MTSFVTAQYGSDKGQVLDPNSKGTPVVGRIDPVTGGIKIISKLTQAQYDAIVTKDDSTLYVIVA